MAKIPRRRLFPRAQAIMPCKVSWSEKATIAGTVQNISSYGIAISLPTTVPPPIQEEMQEQARISLQEPVTLSAIPVHSQAGRGGYVVGFQITRVAPGEEEWKRWTAFVGNQRGTSPMQSGENP